jgi:ABC-type sugar transport system ATPase subunit
VNRFVADFIGRMNLVRRSLAIAGAASGEAAADSVIGIRPEHIELADPAAAGGDHLVGRIEKCVFLGSFTRITLAVGDDRLLLELQGRRVDLTPGEPLLIRIPVEAVHRLEDAAR